MLLVALLCAAPPLLFERDTIDCGVQRCGPPLTVAFPFRNAGNATVTIAGADASCGCAVAAIDKPTLAPGDAGLLRVDVRTLGQAAGPQAWTVRVRVGDAVAMATVRADLVREVDVEPAALMFAGACERPLTIHVADRRASPLRVLGVNTLSPNVKAELIAGEVRVTVAADCPPGERRDEVVIRTSDPDYGELRVPVTVRKSAGVVATPARVAFVVGGGPPSAVIVRVTDRVGRAVKIAGVEASAPLAATWAAGPGNQATVRVSVSAGGTWPTEVRVRVAEPEEAVIVLPVVAVAAD